MLALRVGETLGALLAAEQLTLASDPEVQRILARVVKDEERHAEMPMALARQQCRARKRLCHRRIERAAQTCALEGGRVGRNSM